MWGKQLYKCDTIQVVFKSLADISKLFMRHWVIQSVTVYDLNCKTAICLQQESKESI